MPDKTPHEQRMAEMREWLKRRRRVELFGNAPSEASARRAKIFAAHIQGFVRSLSSVSYPPYVIVFTGDPRPPKDNNKRMRTIEMIAAQYVGTTHYLAYAPRQELFSDSNGTIHIQRSNEHLYGFNVLFLESESESSE